VQIKRELTPKLVKTIKETLKNLKFQLSQMESKTIHKEYNKEEVQKYLQEISEDAKHFKAISIDKIELLEEMLSGHVEIKIAKELIAYLQGYKYKEADKVISEIYKLLENN
jgi:hypothetical protein